MARTILKYNNNCKLCKQFLVSKDKTNLLIKSRDYTSSSLIHPNSTYFKIVKQMFDLSDTILPTIMENDIGKKLIFIFEMNIDTSIFCNKHNLSLILFEKFKNFYLFTLSKNINRVLKGSDSRNYKTDYLKMSARQYYLKHKFKKISCKYCSKTYTCQQHVILPLS